MRKMRENDFCYLFCFKTTSRQGEMTRPDCPTKDAETPRMCQSPPWLTSGTAKGSFPGEKLPKV